MSKIDPGSITWDDAGITWDDDAGKQKQTTASRFAAGLADPIHGGAQLLENTVRAVSPATVAAINRFNNWLAEKGLVGALPSGGVDQQVKEREASLKTDGMDWARLGGNVLSPANAAFGALGALRGGVAGAAGAGALSGAVMPNAGDATDKLAQIGLGAAGGAAVQGGINALSRAISPAASINPQIQALRAEGIRPTIGQTLGGRMNAAEEKLQSLPITGDMITNARNRATAELNTAAANRALSPIGERLPSGVKGREMIDHVQGRLSNAYDSLLPKLTVQADQQFVQELGSLRNMVQTGSMDPNAARAFDRVLQNDLVGKFRGQNAITGQTLKQIESDLTEQVSRYRSSADADQRLVGDALSTVKKSLRDLVERTNPDSAKELQAINKGYANFKTLQRAAGYVGAEDGVFSAAQLQSAVRGADRSKNKAGFAKGSAVMQDLSDSAKSVMGGKVPNSGTADRAMLGAGGLASYFVDPTIPAALIGGAGLYSRPAQNLLTWALAARPQAAQPVAGLLNRASPMLGPAGGLLALDIAE